MAKKVVAPPFELKRLHIGWRIVIWVLFAAYFSLFFARPINLTTADLGRHIRNGQYFVEHGEPIQTNYYSYTQPDYPAVNHHWATGVVFYYVWKWVDFYGSSIFYIGVCLFAALLFVWISLKRADDRYVLLLAVILTPLIAYRTEIRPEGLSYVLLGLSYLLLDKYRRGELGFKLALIVFSVLQIAWINFHIFFFLGPTLMGMHFVADLINGLEKEKIKEYIILIVVSSLAGILNPSWLAGLLTPLTIFQEYGYMLVENQSIPFMMERFGSPEFTHTIVVAVFLVIGLVFILIQKQWRKFLPEIFTALFFGILAFMAVRGITMFALITLPVSAKMLEHFIKRLKSSGIKTVSVATLALAILIITIGLLNDENLAQPSKSKLISYYSPIERYDKTPLTSLGLIPGVSESARFFLETGMKGPIFNNYDIGGFLIFHLYGKEAKVFVDNRPEAYSVPFFKEIYIPMQETEETWREYSEKYNINVIWFYRHDNTPWAQPFLLRRVEDYKNWAPVFVDNYTIMFMKRTPENQPWIQQFELPKDMFRSVPGN